MKKISTLFITVVASVIVFTSHAQTTYTITSNRTWQNHNNSPYPNNCVNCTFNISPGVTLEIDRNVTCQNCTFNGGTISMTNNNLNLQTNSGLSTYFNGTTFLNYGNSKIIGSAPIYITNSTFTFFDNARFNPQQLFELSGSRINFYGNSNLQVTGGPVNLKNNSVLLAGDGTPGSNAYLYFNGPQLNLYDVSNVVLANNNNYYFNWSSYYSVAGNQLYSTMNNNLNCGSGYPHGCQNPYLYGAASLTPGGVVNFNSLPVVLTDFLVLRLNNNTVSLTWNTEQEVNASHFEIEHSTDGGNWQTAGKVAAKGNSQVNSKYAFVHTSPVEGTNYYRLKMVDLDYTYHYSAIKSVTTSSLKNISVFPNPTHDFVNVTVGANAVTVRLVNATGQTVTNRNVQRGSNVISIPVQQYTAGTYLVLVTNADGTKESKSVLIIK